MQRIITLACMAVAIFACSSCSDRKEKKESVIFVRTDTVRSSTNRETLEFPGRVKAAERVNMAFKVAGTLKQIHKNEGDFIKKGEPLAEIDPRDYQLQLQAAESEYNSIKSDAERVIALYSDSVSSPAEYDKARYGLQQIEAKFRNAKNQLADTKIYAPFNGYIERRLFDPPTVVAAGMPVATIISAESPEIEINVPINTYRRIDEAVSLFATFDICPDKKIPLKIKSINHSANANQLYTMRLQLQNSSDAVPTVGMSTMVSILLADKNSAHTVIPATALFERDGKSSVWLYSNGKVTLRPVTVKSLHSNGEATISAGLTEGECVVVAGVHKLSDGQKAEPVAPATAENKGGLL